MEIMLLALAIAVGVAVLDAAVIAAILNLPATAGVQFLLVAVALLVFLMSRRLLPRPVSSLLLLLSEVLKIMSMGDPFMGNPLMRHPFGSGLENGLHPAFDPATCARLLRRLKDMQPDAARADNVFAGRVGLDFSFIVIAVAVGLFLNSGTFGHVGSGWLSAFHHG
jgi:hypothetical protein